MGKVLPIFFNGNMVRAILDGRKTVTRRIVKQSVWENFVCEGGNVVNWLDPKTGALEIPVCKAPYHPGSVMYVRETWTYHDGAVDGIIYKARCPEKLAKSKKWRPSIHMPKQAARIWLKVTGVRVERLQNIKNFQAEGIKLSEGCEECLAVCGECNSDETPIGCDNEIEKFAELWDSTIRKADIGRYGWDANPWVWVIEFERCGKPEGCE